MDYKSFAQKLDCAEHSNELKKALTHKSFYNDKDNDGNSRYVFLGMFGFKGKVAEILFRYQPAGGTQLQHYQGNLFKEVGVRIFDKYGLAGYIRSGTDFDVQTHKHIFAYGFLGFILRWFEPEKLNRFILYNFLYNSEHLLPQEIKNNDIQAQCNFLAQIFYNAPLLISTQKNTDDIFTTNINAGEHSVAMAESKSYRYSRKKALKQALTYMAGQIQMQREQNPQYRELTKKLADAETEKKEKEHNEKIQQHRKKTEQKKEQRAERKKQQKENAELLDQKRRKAKQVAKERQKRIEEEKKKQQAKEANISSSKKRFLDDKKK